MKTLITLILGITLLTPVIAQKAELKLNLEKGKTYHQVTTSNAQIVQDLGGQEMNIMMKITGDISFLVTGVTNEGFEMEARFLKLGMSMEMPQGKMDFDSEKNDSTDIISTVLRSMKDRPFGVTMDRIGKITEVRNIEALWDATINQFGQIPEAQKAQVRDQIKRAYGGDAMKGNIEMVTAIFPDGPISKGDKWSVNTKLESGFSAFVASQFELLDLTKEFALLKGNATIVTADKDAYMENNGFQMKYDLSGTVSSEIKVDRQSGWIMEAKFNQVIKGDAFIKENPQLPNGMKIPMTITSDSQITD